MAATLEQNLRTAAEALASGNVGQLEACRRSLEAAAAAVTFDSSDASPSITLELRRVRALLEHATRHYIGLMGALGVQQFGYDAQGRARRLPSLTGTQVELTG
jgi:hypothetical protein